MRQHRSRCEGTHIRRLLMCVCLTEYRYTKYVHATSLFFFANLIGALADLGLAGVCVSYVPELAPSLYNNSGASTVFIKRNASEIVASIDSKSWSQRLGTKTTSPGRRSPTKQRMLRSASGGSTL